MTWEVSDVVECDVPDGYVVRKHQNRGYDSPDTWYVARSGRWTREFGTLDEAVAACKEHEKTHR